jgi:hypothetical protein
MIALGGLLIETQLDWLLIAACFAAGLAVGQGVFEPARHLG